MEYDCDYFSTENVTLPNVEQQLRGKLLLTIVFDVRTF